VNWPTAALLPTFRESSVGVHGFTVNFQGGNSSGSRAIRLQFADDALLAGAGAARGRRGTRGSFGAVPSLFLAAGGQGEQPRAAQLC